MAGLFNVIQLGSPLATEVVKNTLQLINHETRVKAGQKAVKTRRANAEAKQKLETLVTRFAPPQNGANKAAAKAAKKARQEAAQKQNGWNSLRG